MTDQHSAARTPPGVLGKWLRLAALAAVLVAVAAGGFYVWSNRPLALAVATVEKNVAVRVFGLGTIEARVVSNVGFEVGATLVAVEADHGDLVRKGQVLARLAAGEQEAKVAKAKTAVRIAEVNIDKSASVVAKMRAVLAQKQETSKRKQELANRDVVSAQAAEEALRDEAVAAADVAVAESDNKVATAQVEDARAQLGFEETMLGHRTLLAPFDALVVQRLKEPGAVIKAGDPIMTLVDPATYWGLAFVDEARSGAIVEGQTVEARIRSRPLDTFIGKVLRIGLESDRANEERRIYVKGDNPPAKVFLGEQAEFWITVATLDNALLAPETAVSAYDGREATVWTIEDGALRKRRVSIRHRTEDSRLEVVDGLPEGAQIVVDIGPGLKEGRAASAGKRK
ncbi:MAG: efflux RND transporter periplasmic adaptor subunit [Phyllobacteriaceae bacterium]|nr:efflux RND transporter periplasmic adaptor subunit [Phyllobacteriaceae bacterium]